MSTIKILKEGEVIASSVEMGDCFFKRLVGLTSHKTMDTDEGILLKPCSQIHTYSMSFSIDALFLKKDGEILHIEHNLSPNRISKYIKDAYSVLELKGNTAAEKKLEVGDHIRLVCKEEEEE